MPHRLLIRLLADGATEWLAQGRDGALLQGPRPGLPAESADEVVLLLPAEDVLLLEAPRIGRSRAQLAQALPYAIEEQLAAAVEAQQVAFDERGSGERLAVAVVARARLDAVLARLTAAGLAPDRVHAESQLLPWAAGRPGLLVDGERAVLRWAPSGALVVRSDQLAASLDLLRSAGVAIEALGLLGEAPEGLPAELPVERLGSRPLLAEFAARLATVDGPNLLQGDYRAPRRRAAASGLWRWAAGIAALALLAGFGHGLLERAQLQASVADHQAEMEQLLRHALPGVQRVVDPVAQLEIEYRRLGQGRADGALPLLAQVAPALAGSGRYTLEGLEYRAGTLEIVLVAPDVAALDSLRETLAALPQLAVELTAATPGSRGFEGRLRIRGGRA
jgi:general secretion pathway protein L